MSGGTSEGDPGVDWSGEDGNLLLFAALGYFCVFYWERYLAEEIEYAYDGNSIGVFDQLGAIAFGGE